MFNRKLGLTIALFVALILTAAFEAFGCGAPQPIHGYAYWHPAEQPEMQFRISGARVEIRHEGFTNPFLTVTTNPFGYYKFEDVLPCSNYEITISHKWYVFTPAMKTVLSQDFPNDPEGVQVLFSSVR